MDIAFLAPIFLAGLAAIVIPIVVHLTHSARKNVVPFPSLMFVRQIPFRSVRRQKIRNWLLFALRCAAIVALVTAFARPFFEDSTEAAVALSRAREVVILVDRSYSMGYGDRWQQALSAARDAIDGVGPDDRATLVFFSERPEVASQRTADRATLHAALSTARLASRTTRYPPALDMARETIERSDRPRSEVFLITDFQRIGWDAREIVRLPEGTTLTTVDLSDPDAFNVAVADVTLKRERRVAGERVGVTARVVNHGQRSINDLSLTLEVDGNVVESQSLNLEPRNHATVQFEPATLPQRIAHGSVRAAGDALEADDAFHFIITPSDPISVLLLVLRGDQSRNVYLRRALGIAGDPAFDVNAKRLEQLTEADLVAHDVLILSDAPLPSGAAGEMINDFVRRGGGLLLVLGRRTPPQGSSTTDEGLLPASFGAPIDRSAAGGGTLSWVDYDHPMFEIFSGPRSGDFTTARFFRYRGLQTRSGGRLLARFDDGSGALAERVVGEGRVLVWATDFDNSWNDLAVQPVFLPFVHRVVMHLAGYVEPRPWFDVGDVVDLALPSTGALSAAAMEDLMGASAELVLEEPTGNRQVIVVDRESTLLELSEPGFYKIRSSARTSSADPAYALAVNLDMSESDLSVIDPSEFASSTIRNDVGAEGAAEPDLSELLTPQEKERRQSLWWYMLVAAALLLITETALSNLKARSLQRTAPRAV